MDGIINVYKEKGYTSHDVVAIVRGLSSRGPAGRVKCGHTGTLDPDAEGVLPICLGRATKLSSYIMTGGKRYTAGIKLGVATTTEDASGEVVSEAPVNVSPEEFRKAALSFVGEYDQVPPMYSAVKINGQKLYKLARAGKEVRREPRRVCIYDMGITEISYDKYLLDVSCSSGTYIRTLCADIGKTLGCGAHMDSLLRTEASGFRLSDAVKIGRLREMEEEGRLSEAVVPMERALDRFPRVKVAAAAEKILKNGGRVYGEFLEVPEGILPGEKVLAYFGGVLAGIYEYVFDGERYAILPVRVLQ